MASYSRFCRRCILSRYVPFSWRPRFEKCALEWAAEHGISVGTAGLADTINITCYAFAEECRRRKVGKLTRTDKDAILVEARVEELWTVDAVYGEMVFFFQTDDQKNLPEDPQFIQRCRNAVDRVILPYDHLGTQRKTNPYSL